MVTCLGLIITTSLAPGTRLENAYQQARLAVYLDARIEPDIVAVLSERSQNFGSGDSCLQPGGECWFSVTMEFTAHTGWVDVLPNPRYAKELADVIGSDSRVLYLPEGLRFWRAYTDPQQAPMGDFRATAAVELRIMQSRMVGPIGSDPVIEHWLIPGSIPISGSADDTVVTGTLLRVDNTQLAPQFARDAFYGWVVVPPSRTHTLLSFFRVPRRLRIPATFDIDFFWADEAALINELDFPPRGEQGRTLKEFRAVWDRLISLGELREVKAPSLDNVTIAGADHQVVSVGPGQRPNDPSKFLSGSRYDDNKWLSPSLGFWTDNGVSYPSDNGPEPSWSGPEVAFSIISDPVGTSVLDAVLEKNRNVIETTDWLGAPFDDAFPEFAEVADALQTTSITELQSHIDQLRREVGPQLSVFGANLPQQAVASWGIIILTVILSYFAVHLRRFEPQSDRAKFPWIALYGDRVSKTLCVASIFLLPMAATASILQNWFGSGPSRWVVAGLASGSVAIFFLAAYTVRICLNISSKVSQGQTTGS